MTSICLWSGWGQPVMSMRRRMGVQRKTGEVDMDVGRFIEGCAVDGRSARSQLLVQNFAQLFADVLHLIFGEVRVDQVKLCLAALKAHDPNLPLRVDAAVAEGGFVDQQPLSHEDEAEHEAEVELGGLGGVGKALEEAAQNFVVDKEFFLRLGMR